MYTHAFNTRVTLIQALDKLSSPRFLVPQTSSCSDMWSQWVQEGGMEDPAVCVCWRWGHWAEGTDAVGRKQLMGGRCSAGPGLLLGSGLCRHWHEGLCHC